MAIGAMVSPSGGGGQPSWYADFSNAASSGDPNQVIAWAQNGDLATRYSDFDAAAGDLVGSTVASMQKKGGGGGFSLSNVLKTATNPLKYGDALGLTYGPLSGRAPGKLTDAGLDLQGKVNPGISRGALESANDAAPWIAGALASMGASGMLSGSTAAGAGGTAGYAMPAAEAVSPEALSSMGLTQTVPGVWEAGAGSLAGIGAGSTGYGIGEAAGGAASPEAVGAGAPAASPATTIAAPAAPSAAAGAGTSQAGGSFVDSLISQMKNNALSLGLMGVGTAASLANRPKQMPNEQQLQGLGAEAAATAKQLMAQYNSGQLSSGQQASLDQLAQNTKNQLRQYFASIGQADSTAAAQAMAQVDQQVLGMKQQMLDNALQQGLQAIGVAQGPFGAVANYQLGQDQALRQAFSNFAGSAGQLFGRNSGGPQQPQPTASATAAPVITSTQSNSPVAMGG